MTLPDGRVVHVEALDFVSDPALLSKSRHDRTSDAYDWAGNHIVLRVDGRNLEPVRHLFPAHDDHGYQYSLPMFMDAARPMGEGHSGSHGAAHGVSEENPPVALSGRNAGMGQQKPQSRPVALVVATKHHVDGLFVVSFAVVLLAMALLLGLTWKKRLA